MKKLYIFLVIFFLTTCFYGQEADNSSEVQETAIQNSNEIKGFKMYPNPVVNGKLFIFSFNKATKRILIYNVLGKQIVATTIRGAELNVSRLDAGIYILKVFENGKTATRKLVIK